MPINPFFSRWRTEQGAPRIVVQLRHPEKNFNFDLTNFSGISMTYEAQRTEVISGANWRSMPVWEIDSGWNAPLKWEDWVEKGIGIRSFNYMANEQNFEAVYCSDIRIRAVVSMDDSPSGLKFYGPWTIIPVPHDALWYNDLRYSNPNIDCKEVWPSIHQSY